MKNRMDFHERTVLVTGASGLIGMGIARRFAESGARIAVHYRNDKAGAEALAEEIGAAAEAVKADLTDEQEVEELFSLVRKRMGRLDVLINNAGVYPVTPLTEMSAAEWYRVLDSNLTAVHYCTQQAAQLMKDNPGGGAVVNIASIEAQRPAPGHAHYGAAKGGVLEYTKAAACELAEVGIRVNSVSPGLIWRAGIETDWPDGVERYLKAAPIKRLGTAEDIAEACLFLASPGAGWITGADLTVDGGLSAGPGY